MRKFSSLIHQLLLLALWRSCGLWVTFSGFSSLDKNAVLLIPADTDQLTGSKGDEAMLLASMSALARISHGLKCIVATSNKMADGLARRLGMGIVRVWGGPMMPLTFMKHLRQVRPSIGLVTGADIMDGHYSPVMSLRMIIAADLMARNGARTAFIGFSLNDKPAPLVKFAFRHLDRRVKVHLRDPLSWERYRRFTGRDGALVADSAFLLKPSQKLDVDTAATARWMQAERDAGRLVLVLNLHPMLFPREGAEASIDRLLDSVLFVQKALTGKRSLSWLLLPHDNRPASGDMKALHELFRRTDVSMRAHARLVDVPPAADEIKALMGYADGAITGRMHLAIAALGQSVPVLAFAYQDKFAGLIMHFGLPDWIVLDAESSTSPVHLEHCVDRFVLALPELREQVGSMLPKVEAAANSTFDIL